MFIKDGLIRNVRDLKPLNGHKNCSVLTSWTREKPWFWLWSSSCCFLRCSCLADWRHMVIISVQASILLLLMRFLPLFQRKKNDPVPVFLFWGAVVLVRVYWGDDGVGPVISSLPSARCPPPARPHDASRIKLRLRLTAATHNSPRSAPSTGENKHTRC